MSHSDDRSAADSQPHHAQTPAVSAAAAGTASATNGAGPSSVRPPLHAATAAGAASSSSPAVSRPSSLSQSSGSKRVSFDLTPTAGVLTESLLAGSFTDSDPSGADAHGSDIALTTMSDQRLADRSKQSYSSIAADDDDDLPPPLEDAHGHGHGNGACSGHGHSHSPALSSGSRNQRSPGTPGTPRRSPETNCGGLKKKTKSEEANRRARRQLGYASVFCLVFMICEIIGGLIANSLAIMTDAAHLLSDLAGFLISIFALWLATRPATSRLSFGFHRAEIIGALLSVLLIWVLTGILVYEACWRMVHPEDVDGKIMFIVAVCGLAVNFAMGLILIQSGHGHSHGGLPGADDHGHSHSHGGKPKPKKSKKRAALTDGGDHGHSHGGDGAHGHSHGGSGDAAEYKGLNDESAHSSGDEHDHDDGHGHAHGPAGDDHIDHPEEENLNVKAAFIHVLGDAIQSFGVMIAAALIWYNPEWKIADPLCTFLFSIVVLFTTTRLIKQSIAVLMEGVPDGIDPDEVEEALMNVPGVIAVHDLHIWSLSVGKPSLSVHLYCRDDASHVLAAANKMCAAKYNIQHSTIQVERQHDDVECNDAFVQVDGHASLDRITAENFASLGLVAEQV